MKTGGSISVLLSFLNTAIYHDQHTLQEYVTYFNFSVIAVIIIVELILKFRDEIKRIHKMPTWLPANAKILRSRMVFEYSSSVETDPVLHFEYRYNVNGTEYTSTSIPNYFIDVFNSDLDDRIMEQFPEGSETQIYYNPENPGEAVLMGRGRAIVFINCLFLCLFWIVAMLASSHLLIHFHLTWISYIFLIVFLSIYIPVKMKRKVRMV